MRKAGAMRESERCAKASGSCRKNVEEPDPEQIRKDLERLEMIRKKR
jgi:hypothetical protein